MLELGKVKKGLLEKMLEAYFGIISVKEAGIASDIDPRRICDYCRNLKSKRPFKKRLYIWKYLS